MSRHTSEKYEETRAKNAGPSLNPKPRTEGSPVRDVLQIQVFWRLEGEPRQRLQHAELGLTGRKLGRVVQNSNTYHKQSYRY